MFEHRTPAVAGRFYPRDPALLDALVGRCTATERPSRPAHAIIAPHAGYDYSGAIAGQTWAAIHVPRRIILLCPNHTGSGARRAIWPSGRWSIPGGALEIDKELAARLIDRCGLTPDAEAHRAEHGIEVHLPFLYTRRPDATIVPICLGRHSLGECMELSAGVAEVLATFDEPILLVASSDMSHYHSADEARAYDDLAIDRLLALDPAGLYRLVRARQIHMCGLIPAVIALQASRLRGADATHLIGCTCPKRHCGGPTTPARRRRHPPHRLQPLRRDQRRAPASHRLRRRRHHRQRAPRPQR
jgi:AmmeMemoRadiSam system protein B